MSGEETIVMKCSACNNDEEITVVDISHVIVKSNPTFLHPTEYSYVSHYIQTKCKKCGTSGGFFDEYLRAQGSKVTPKTWIPPRP